MGIAKNRRVNKKQQKPMQAGDEPWLHCQFASFALMGLLAVRPEGDPDLSVSEEEENLDWYSRRAFYLADAMMKEWKKRRG